MSELDEPIWAVVANDGMPVRSRHTNYAEAVRRMEALHAMSAVGLAITTDDVAERIESEKNAQVQTV